MQVLIHDTRLEEVFFRYCNDIHVYHYFIGLYLDLRKEIK